MTVTQAPTAAVAAQSTVVDDRGYDADVIVVGAGPAGSAAAYWLATAGLDVALLEKTTFPREKVCGDGLTPRGTRALVDMGIDVSEDAGWLHNEGLRVIGGGLRLAPRLARADQLPATTAWSVRAPISTRCSPIRPSRPAPPLHEQTTVTEPVLDRRRPGGRGAGRDGRGQDAR